MDDLDYCKAWLAAEHQERMRIIEHQKRVTLDILHLLHEEHLSVAQINFVLGQVAEQVARCSYLSESSGKQLTK